MEKKSKFTGLTESAVKVVQVLKAIAEVADEVLAAAVRGFSEKRSEPEPPSKSHVDAPGLVSDGDMPAPAPRQDPEAKAAQEEAAEATTTVPAWVRFEAIAETEFGQTVCVAGDALSLGAWDPERAVPLDPAEYPKWSGRARIEREGPVEYKYVKKKADGSFVWEALSGNRKVESDASGARAVRTDEVSWEAEETEATPP